MRLIQPREDPPLRVRLSSPSLPFRKLTPTNGSKSRVRDHHLTLIKLGLKTVNAPEINEKALTCFPALEDFFGNVLPMSILTLSPQIATPAAPPRATRRSDSGAAGARKKRLARADGSGVQREVNNASEVLSRSDLKRLSRFQKDGYRRIGALDSVMTCGTIPILQNLVGLGVNQGKGSLQVSGFYSCASRWCPDCWGKVSQKRSEDVSAVAEWAVSQGLRLVLMTLTASHQQESVLQACDGDEFRALQAQSVADLFNCLGRAWRSMNSGQAGKFIGSTRVGYARSFELTVDSLFSQHRSGVHGHYHCLLILPFDADVDSLRELYFSQWSKACAKNDLRSSRKGFDFKVLDVKSDPDSIRKAASYLTKGESLKADKVGMEMTRSDSKSGHFARRVSPEGFLREVGSLSDEDFGKVERRAFAQWRDIEEGCKGRRWLTWSRDIRKMAGLGVEKTDEELAAEEFPVQDDVYLVVHYPTVKDHLDELRSHMSEIPPEERFDFLRSVLELNSVPYVEVPSFEWHRALRCHCSPHQERRLSVDMSAWAEKLRPD